MAGLRRRACLLGCWLRSCVTRRKPAAAASCIGAFHCPSATSPPIVLTSHRLSSAVQLIYHCLSLHFHCLSLPFLDFPLP